MDRDSDGEEHYAIVVLNELRSSKFLFTEERQGNSVIYTFVVPNHEDSGPEMAYPEPCITEEPEPS